MANEHLSRLLLPEFLRPGVKSVSKHLGDVSEVGGYVVPASIERQKSKEVVTMIVLNLQLVSSWN